MQIPGMSGPYPLTDDSSLGPDCAGRAGRSLSVEGADACGRTETGAGRIVSATLDRRLICLRHPI